MKAWELTRQIAQQSLSSVKKENSALASFVLIRSLESALSELQKLEGQHPQLRNQSALPGLKTQFEDLSKVDLFESMARAEGKIMFNSFSGKKSGSAVHKLQSYLWHLHPWNAARNEYVKSYKNLGGTEGSHLEGISENIPWLGYKAPKMVIEMLKVRLYGTKSRLDQKFASIQKILAYRNN